MAKTATAAANDAEAQADLGGNAGRDLRDRIERLDGLLDELAEVQEQIKALKTEMKEDGYNMRAVGQILKERRRGAEFQAAQLTLELEVDTYRRATGLPVTLEAAQAAVLAGASEV